MPGRRGIELHDSTVTAMRWEGPTLILRATVYVHAGDGAPGVSRGVGWFQESEISIGDARVERPAGEIPFDILDGIIRVDGLVYDNVLPLPFEHFGSTRVELEEANGEFVVAGSHINVVLKGEPGEVEEFEGLDAEDR